MRKRTSWLGLGGLRFVVRGTQAHTQLQARSAPKSGVRSVLTRADEVGEVGE